MFTSIYTGLFPMSLRLPGNLNSWSGLNFFLFPFLWSFFEKEKERKGKGERGMEERRAKEEEKIILPLWAYCHSPASMDPPSSKTGSWFNLHPRWNVDNLKCGQSFQHPGHVIVISKGPHFYAAAYSYSHTMSSVIGNQSTSTVTHSNILLWDISPPFFQPAC